MTDSRFERDTAVTRVDERRFTGRIDPGWAVIDDAAPNGGYVMALAARAMRDGLAHPDPVSLTAHFLAPPQPGEVDIDIEVVRSSRRHSTVTGAVRQDGREMTRLLGVFADLDAAEGYARVDLEPPPLPPREDCTAMRADTAAAAAPATPGAFAPPPIFQRLEHRMPPALMGWAFGAPTGTGEAGGYVRWPDVAAVDSLGLLVIADCYPPAALNLGGDAPAGWVPTLELTVQVRKRPAPGWLATWFTTKAVTAGYLEEDGTIWDAYGDVVALSRQLALMPRAPRGPRTPGSG